MNMHGVITKSPSKKSLDSVYSEPKMASKTKSFQQISLGKNVLQNEQPYGPIRIFPKYMKNKNLRN